MELAGELLLAAADVLRRGAGRSAQAVKAELQARGLDAPTAHHLAYQGRGNRQLDLFGESLRKESAGLAMRMPSAAQHMKKPPDSTARSAGGQRKP